MLEISEPSLALRTAESAAVLRKILPYIYPRKTAPFVLTEPPRGSFPAIRALDKYRFAFSSGAFGESELKPCGQIWRGFEAVGQAFTFVATFVQTKRAEVFVSAGLRSSFLWQLKRLPFSRSP